VHHKVPFRKYGYIAGENDQYIQANVLTNLMTVCIECHQRIETADHNPTGLDGLAYILSQMAPLLVMCDPSDLATVADWDSHNTKLPTITLYELTPGGMGFSEELYQKHTTLLSMCVERIKECSCERGCPACVGPPGETLDGTARNLKDDTLHLIATFDRIYNE
jgi:DEAD/DEAH box helicase domain-containing protein